MKTLRLMLLSVAGLSTSLVAAPAPPLSGDAPMRIVRSDPPVFPRSAEVLGLRRGEARIAILVDNTGRMRDSLVVGYSQRSFAEAAISAIKAWHFEPIWIHGIPRGGVAVLKFTFETEGAMVNVSLIDDLTEPFFRMIQGDPIAFSACMPHDLDRIPIPTRIVQPIFPMRPGGHSAVGHVTVKFYIDDQGGVRLPRISSEAYVSNDELGAWALADVAVAAVAQWRFEPPLANGKPTVVLVEQDFDFKPPGP